MRYVRRGDTYLIRFEDGELFPDRFLEFLAAEGIGAGSFTGIGAMRWTKIAFFDIASNEYRESQLDEQLEVLALLGNVALFEAQPIVHAHITLGRPDYTVIGGHLRQGEVRPTLELSLRVLPEPLSRKIDSTYGLRMLDL